MAIDPNDYEKTTADPDIAIHYPKGAAVPDGHESFKYLADDVSSVLITTRTKQAEDRQTLELMGLAVSLYMPTVYYLDVELVVGRDIAVDTRWDVVVEGLTEGYSAAVGKGTPGKLRYTPDMLISKYGANAVSQYLDFYPYDAKTVADPDAPGEVMSHFSVLIISKKTFTVPTDGNHYGAFIQVTNSEIRAGFSGNSGSKTALSSMSVRPELAVDSSAEKASARTHGGTVPRSVSGAVTNDNDGVVHVRIP